MTDCRSAEESVIKIKARSNRDTLYILANRCWSMRWQVHRSCSALNGMVALLSPLFSYPLFQCHDAHTITYIISVGIRSELMRFFSLLRVLFFTLTEALKREGQTGCELKASETSSRTLRAIQLYFKSKQRWTKLICIEKHVTFFSF